MENTKVLRNYIQNYSQHIVKYGVTGDELSRFCEGFWQKLDQFVDESVRSLTSVCSNRCHHCCAHYPGSLEIFELIHIYGNLRKSPRLSEYIMRLWERQLLFQKVLDKAVLQVDGEEEQDDLALLLYLQQKQMCPFLSPKGSCEIYEFRPSTCRLFQSSKNPEYCQGEYHHHSENGNYLIEFPEEIEEALFELSKNFESLEISNNFFEGILNANAMEDFWDEIAIYKNVE